MINIAPTAIIKNPEAVHIGHDVTIMDYAIIGVANYYQDLFDNDRKRRVVIGDRSRIYPWALIYEGANIGADVVMEERTTVGSLTTVGARTRILYQAQINDQIRIGEQCIIGGFVADNCSVGNRCSVFGALVHRYLTPSLEAWDTTDEPGPILEDDVVVGWGAVLVGQITVGRGARILPVTLVTENVAPGERYYGRRNQQHS